MDITQHEDEASIISNDDINNDDEKDDSSKSSGVADDSSDDAGVDNNSIENRGVGGINHPDNAGVAHSEIAGVPAPNNNEASLNTEMDRKYGPQNKRDGLRPCKPRDYSHLYADLEHTAFNQHNVRKGLKIFGEAGAQRWLKKYNCCMTGR
jgi:hypothetical protein